MNNMTPQSQNNDIQPNLDASSEFAANDANDATQIDSQSLKGDSKQALKTPARSDVDGFGDWDDEENQGKSDAEIEDEFEFKDEPLYGAPPAKAENMKKKGDVNAEASQKIDHVDSTEDVESAAFATQEKPQEGQLVDLSDLDEAETEQQVDYALAKKNSFWQQHLKKIGIVGVVLCGGGVAVALAGFNTKVTVAQTTTVEQMAVPEADKSKFVAPSAEEKAQRDLVEQEAAKAALANGQTFTPEFTPQGLQPAQLMPPPVEMPPPAPLPPPQPEMPAAPPPPPPVDTLSEAELEKVRESVFNQADSLVKANNGQNGFNTVTYARKSNGKEAANFYSDMPEAQRENVATDAQSAATSKTNKKKYRIIAGGMMYATLNQAVNSDDGFGAVFATLHGGPFNGATLIGKIEEAPDNIRLSFSQITTQDGETIDVVATAIREKDARAGMAEGVNNHMISRYSYLFISSFLKGLGEFAKPPSTILSNAFNSVEKKERPEAKDIVREGLGDAGKAMSSEAKQNFNRRPTYTIPQNQAFAVLFSKNVE